MVWVYLWNNLYDHFSKSKVSVTWSLALGQASRCHLFGIEGVNRWWMSVMLYVPCQRELCNNLCTAELRRWKGWALIHSGSHLLRKRDGLGLLMSSSVIQVWPCHKVHWASGSYLSLALASLQPECCQNPGSECSCLLLGLPLLKWKHL